MKDGQAKIEAEIIPTVLTSVLWGFCSKAVILKIPVMLFQSLNVFGNWSGKKGEGIGLIEANNAKQILE